MPSISSSSSSSSIHPSVVSHSLSHNNISIISGSSSNTIHRKYSNTPVSPRKKCSHSTRSGRRLSAAEDIHCNDPDIPWITAIWTYLNYAVLIAFGHMRDIGIWLFGKSKYVRHTPLGYAPLVREFEDFYTRRMYHRIQDCFNRPINSCPAATIDIMERRFKYNGKQPELIHGKYRAALNLGSYNYLGFGDPDSVTKDDVMNAVDMYGNSTCSTRNSLGTTSLHDECEKLVAQYVGKESSMIFGMGHGTNSTSIPSLIGRGGLIVSDSINHNSLTVGCRLSGAVIRVFKHNDVDDLEHVIREAIINGQPLTHRPWSKILIMIEGIYSMEGEMCPLNDIVRIKKKYKCYLYVDEAHSIGAVGPSGRGVCDHFGVDPRDVDILMGTFTKSFGSVGGYVAADKHIIDFLRCHSAGHVYSASISPPAVQQIISALNIMSGATHGDLGQRKIQQLHSNANYFRQRMIDMGCQVLGTFDSPVVPVMLYNPGKIAGAGRLCLKAGIAIVTVGFPATPLLLSRVRFCLSAAHTQQQLEEACNKLEIIARKMGLFYEKPFWHMLLPQKLLDWITNTQQHHVKYV